MTISFSNIAKAFLLESVSNSAVQFIIDPGEYEKFLPSGDYVYAQLADAGGNKEIVKIDISASSAHTIVEETYSGGLTVSRGQGGTSARAWPRGTLIYQEITKTFLNDVRQKAGHRTVAYNPNGVLSPNYTGEKVYRSDVSGWWKSFNGTDPVWLLIGGVATGDILVYPTDDAWTWDVPDGWDNSWGVWYTDPWESIFDNAKWESNDEWSIWTGSVWAVGQEEEGESYTIALEPIGGWEVDFRPSRIRITHTFAKVATVQNDFLLHNTCIGGGCPTFIASDANLVSLKEKNCFFDGYDISNLSFSSPEDEGAWTVTNIEFIED